MAAYKRLQQIGEPETWTISLDPHDIKWSNQSHSMRMFFEKYGHHLPLLIQVTEGFDGIDGFHTFSSGDVYWVSGIHSQSRVIVKDQRNRNISIPLSYNGLFNIVYKNGKRKENTPMTLEAAVEKWQMSIENFDIELHDDGEVRVNVRLNTENVGYLGLLELVDTYDELSFIGYSIFRAGAVCKQPCLIPLYVDIQVCVSKGHSIAHQYDEFVAELKQITNKLPPRGLQACNDVIMFGDEKLKSEYNYIVPYGYTEFPAALSNSSPYGYCQAITTTPQQQQQPAITTFTSYETGYNSSEKSGKVKSPASGPPITNNTTSPPRLPPTRPPKPDVSGLDQQDQAIATAASTGYRQPTAGAKGPPVPVRAGSISTAASKQPTSGDRRPSEPLVSANQSSAYYNTSQEVRSQSENEYEITRGQPAGRPMPSSKPSVASSVTESTKPATIAPKSTTNTARQQPQPQNNTLVESLTQRFNKINARTTPDNDESGGGGGGESDIYASLADVPRKVEHMTTAQLVSAVRHIFPKNPEYAEKLREMELDGNIIKDITKEVFVSELCFSQVDALKMTKFVCEGWKPDRNNTPSTKKT